MSNTTTKEQDKQLVDVCGNAILWLNTLTTPSPFSRSQEVGNFVQIRLRPLKNYIGNLSKSKLTQKPLFVHSENKTFDSIAKFVQTILWPFGKRVGEQIDEQTSIFSEELRNKEIFLVLVNTFRGQNFWVNVCNTLKEMS